MQLMTFNSLLMFDIVFMFFLFLVGVTCLVYYLPTGRPHRPFVQTAESLLEAEKCRYRHRHLHLLSQKNGHADRILTDEASSEYEDDEEEDINDDESDEFEEIPKTQSRKHHQQLQNKQHSCHIHNQNQNDEPCLDAKEINFIERNEIELVKLRNKGYYPLPRQQQHQLQFSQRKENNISHKRNKILYHCCPPCNLSDCENFYISYEDPSNITSNTSSSSNKGNNNEIFTSSMITTYKDTDTINTIRDDNISSSARLVYLNGIPTSKSNEISKGSNIGCNISRSAISDFIDIDNIHKNRKNNYIDYKKNSPLLKLKSKAIVNKKQTSAAAAIAKSIIEIKEANKIQPILSLPSSILSTIDEKTNVPDDEVDGIDDDDDVDDDGDVDDAFDNNDDEYEEYIYEDDDCCSTTSVDIVLAEGIDEDASNVIIYDNKRKCQHNCKNRYINSNRIASQTKKAFNNNNNSNNNNNNNNNNSQHTSLNINAAAFAAAATLREHFYIIKETEKIKEGTTSFSLAHQPYCCHVKAKSNDLKDCVGPIVDV
ncbi:probable basic-leucine zipper transcription factor E isoform X2 [Condylostylus longicornis]|uniref:probable basic-leucine zipper transcription factor E isoform X2 n=1 Tax=Condylostylus longicornis TaxID=2530218 RepID=UPI00244E10CE|nr:probable basic-leucine zipper transcription factor E isoform X2 [Condylostylus longicornis]